MPERDPLPRQRKRVWTITTGRVAGRGRDRHCVLPTVQGPDIDGDLEVVPRDEFERLAQIAGVYFHEFDHLIGELDYPERRDLRKELHRLGEAGYGTP